MAKPLSGQIVVAGNHYKTRVRLPDGSRPWVHLRPGLTESQARAEAIELQRLATSGELLRDDDDQAPKGETVAEWFARWALDREERGLVSVDEDRSRFATHIAPFIGEREMAKVTTREIERLRDHLDKQVRLRDTSPAGRKKQGMSGKLAELIWTNVKSMFKAAHMSKIASLRCREDNPTQNVEAPDRRDRRARTYLYPDELASLLTCEVVPVHRRKVYAFASYTALRKGELAVLTPADVDFAARHISVHKAADRRTKGAVKSTKTGKARRVPIEPALVPLLQVMIEGQPRDARFVPVYDERNMADVLRSDLRKAGVTREAVFADTATQAPLDFHDLRGSAATWWAVRGDSPLKIRSRLGHSGLAMTERYIREAETFAELFGEPFPTLPACLLVSDERAHRMDQALDQATSAPPTLHRKKTSRMLVGGTGVEPEKNVPNTVFLGVSDHDCHENHPRNAPLDHERSIQNEPHINLDDALAAALTEATKAGQWAIVGQLATELEARRRDRAGVVELATERAKRGVR